MPEMNRPDREPDDKRQFIKEKIVKQPLTRRQIAGRAAMMGGMGVLFFHHIRSFLRGGCGSLCAGLPSL